MDKGQVKAEVKRAFQAVSRPVEFTNAAHCDECAEHNQTLQAHTPETISLAELGNAGWDPICFVWPTAFLYYFPAMARLVLDEPEDYLDQFLFHLTYEGEQSRFFHHFTPDQRQATLSVLRYIEDELTELVFDYMLAQTLDDAITLWTNLLDQT
jgi:hypothetical protein